MNYSSRIILEPPLIYLKTLDNPEYSYKEKKKLNGFIRFLKNISLSSGILEDQKEGFRKDIENKINNFDKATKMMNELANEVKQNIEDKNVYNKTDTIEVNKALISKFVAYHSETEGLSSDFDWDNIELFEKFHDYVYRLLGAGAFTFKNNDWYDLFNHAYVTKNRKYLTSDKKKWKKVSEDTGLSHFIIDCDKYKKPHFR